MTPQEKARKLRPLIVKASTSLPDEDALNGIELFPAWQTDHIYAVDERIRYGDKLYRVVQAHTSQADWTPDQTPALWTEVAAPGEILVWKQPTGAHDAYQTGDKVYYPDIGDTIYICIADNNIYAPGVYGWEIYKEN